MIIKRKVYSQIQKHLSQKEISLIVGLRRVGKTTILRFLIDEIKQRNEKVIYFNLDREKDSLEFQSQEKIIFLINQEIKKLKANQKLYLFIDELQRKKNAGIFIKGIYDFIDFNNLNVKIVATGSGSLELKEQIKESLAGRKKIFQLNTLSFYEFVKFKRNLKSDEKVLEFANLFEEKIKIDFIEYLNYGGFPDVVLASNEEEKQEKIAEIYESYLEKDVKQLLNIKKSKSFSNLVKLLSSQVGSLVNKAELARTVGVSKNTIDKYIWYLEKTFVINQLNPFFKNPRKEITKMPVIHFNDLGLRSYASGNFNFNPFDNINGGIFENFVYLMLKNSVKKKNVVGFWRTIVGAEVDFIIGSYLEAIPVEVKMKKFNSKVKYGKSFYSFLDKYQPKQAFLYNLDTSKEEKVKGINVKTLKFYEKVKI